VTCRIRSPTGAEIDIDIVENTDGTFNIQFTPSFPGDYSISIKFGGQSIPEGDYVVQVRTWIGPTYSPKFFNYSLILLSLALSLINYL